MKRSKSRIQVSESIRQVLSTSDEFAIKSVVALYAYMEPDEKSEGYALYHNNVSFNFVDSKFFSSMAEYIISGHKVTGHQLEVAHRALIKYSYQLSSIPEICELISSVKSSLAQPLLDFQTSVA